MELTVDQALQQGIAAQKEGRLQDAERLYRAILQSQPNHPDANHNLGVLAVSVGKPLTAIPLFKLALEANSQIEQFWLSYIDALIKAERLEDARHVVVKGEKAGVSSEKLDTLNQRLQRGAPNNLTKTRKGQTLSEKRKKLADKKKNKKRKVQGDSSSTEPSQDQINHLLEHYQAGRLKEAEALATSLTQQFPKHPFGWKVLGVVFAQTLRLDEAEASYRQAIALKPDDAKAHVNLGTTLQELGRLDEAEASYRQAIALKPDYAEAYYNLGNTLQKMGKLDEAEASYRRAIALKPDYAEAHSNLGVMLKGLGSLDKAETSYRQAISLKPDYAGAHSNLGILLKGLGRLDEAEASLRQAIALQPDYAEAHSNLGLTLQELGRLEQAEASYRQAIVLKPNLAETHYNLGITLEKLRSLDEAKATYRQAIALRPDFADAHSNLGLTLKELGRFEEAEAHLRHAISLKPEDAEIHRNLATAKKFLSEDEQFYQMHALYRDPAISEKSRCHICFALAKATGDLRDYGTAFQFYAEGNALRKKQLGYDKAQDKKLFERLKSSYPRITAYPLSSEIVVPEHTPIFIVGLPRSGTTLVEQIISSHPLITGAGELPFVSQFGSSLAINQTPVDGEALATFRKQYLNALQQRSEGKAFVTDKMPQNFQFLGLIATAFPDAKIIHVKRDPAAVCWANYTQYFVNDSLGYCYSLHDILHYHDLYQDLMRHWHQTLPSRIYDLTYEVLTENQEEQTRKIIDHLGLQWDDTCLSPEKNSRSVGTASNVQVRQKVYQGSSERWKRYKPYLNGALDSLGLDNQRL